jgi:archaellum component FlaC
MEWDDAEATLATEAGRKMANDYFKEDLPLHMAVERKAPDSTILALLDANPNAASLTGRLGGTPLHLAAQQKLSPAVLVALIRAYPEALDQEDDARNHPRDYAQKNEMSREALCRPTACWIEDVEKEDYDDKVDRKRSQLRQKMESLKGALDNSRRRREALSEYIQELEPRLQTQRDVLGRLKGMEKQMKQLYDTYQAKVEKVRERIKMLSDEVSFEPDDDETMMRSLMKRTYMQGVQRQYEKLIARTDHMRKDIHTLRVLAEQRRSAANVRSSQGGDDDSI